MKKILRFLSLIAVLFTLAACSSTNTSNDKMYIEQAKFTDEEQAILDLVGENGSPYILDFIVDDTVKTLQINTYELQDGKWHLISGGGGHSFEDKYGRIALSFDKIENGMRTAIQSEHAKGSTSYHKPKEEAIEGMGTATSRLSSRTNIEYEKEIPLVMEVSTTKNEVRSFDPDYGFKNPEKYKELGYEKVYVITCMFSQKTLSELDDAMVK
ncbi:MAG: hypothetical protein RSF82_11340 [Angelakisella sp.]